MSDTAIEALRYSEFPNSSDCISRQAALDALNEQIEQCNKALGSFDISLKDEFAIKVERASLEAYKEQLENLPSAQPEKRTDKRTETHACDYISRQAAIKAVHEEFDGCLVWDESGKRTADEVEMILDCVPAVPSQPEIIRCKNCKHFEHDHPYIIQGIPVLGHEVCNAWGDGCKTNENGYCFMAERRTDE